jgi:hypothetical protein
MSLNVRLYNINSPNNFTLDYTSGSYQNTYTNVGTFTGGTTSVVIPNLNFNTLYYTKITDTVTNQYVIDQINTNQSSYFECYKNIDFIITTSGDCCNGIVATLFDLIYPYGNHSSVISGTTNTYKLYSGSTIDFGTATFISNVTTDPNTNIIYQTTFTNTNKLVYFFLEHGDGSIFHVGNDPNKQGGFNVQSVYIDCPPPITPTPYQTPTPTSTLYQTPTPTQTITLTPTPTNSPSLGILTLDSSYGFIYSHVYGPFSSFTYPTSPNSTVSQNYAGTIPAQTISVTISGATLSSLSDLKQAITLDVNGITNDYHCIPSGSNGIFSFGLNIASPVTQPLPIRISSVLGYGSCP